MGRRGLSISIIYYKELRESYTIHVAFEVNESVTISLIVSFVVFCSMHLAPNFLLPLL